MRRGRWVIVLSGLSGAVAIAAACTGEDAAVVASGDSGNCGRVACIGRCGSVVDECGQTQACAGCAFGECSDAGFCTCPQPPSVACGDKLCGTAINACGQTVQCGPNGGACATPGDVCTTDGGTCCTPDNVSACAGKCGGTAVNNCGETITCNRCAGSEAAVCLPDTKACCTPQADWCTNRCGKTKDNCGQDIDCGGCPGSVACTASSACGCDAEAKTKTCGSRVCGSQTNNCGQAIACGNNTTACATAGDVCQSDGTCCTPKSDQETCAGRCGPVKNNCGTTVNCGNACPTLCGKGTVGPTTCCTPQCSGVVCEANDTSCGVKCAEATTSCWKNTRFLLKYADLNAVSGKNCANTSAAIDDGECFTAVYRYCKAKGWAAGWFVANGEADVQAICVSGPSAAENTTWPVLATFHPGCSEPSKWASGACVAAADGYCASKGYAGGLGVVELHGYDTIDVMCLKGTYVSRYEVAAVAQCSDLSTGSCYTAVDSICYNTFGHLSSANAVQIGSGKMQVMCVKTP